MKPNYLSGGVFLVGLLLVATAAAMQAQARPSPPAPSQTAPPPNTPAKASASHDADNGDLIFAQNCSRCHRAPESVSPRIAGTVLRHMRVRAQLSQTDAEAVLRFLNP
ncbi:cytochrome c [Acidipila sp. EB88]|nr:cytochrome c [Acidipila sp. EB88]